jgi:5S rRNA maturation endonuclease (ribonuclease M5)
MVSQVIVTDLKELAATGKLNSSEEFYITCCPECQKEKGKSYHKTKLYISSDFEWGFCQRCKTLFKKEIDFTNDVEASPIKSKMYVSNVLKDIQVYTSMKKYEEASPVMDEKAKNYLKSRNPELLKLWDVYGMRCDEEGIYIKYPGYNYYIRANYDRRFLKYYLPPTPEKPTFNIERDPKRWIVCEGVFDAFALSLLNENDSIMAVTGSTMTTPQLNHFRNLLPREVYVFLDDTRLSNDLRNNLSKNLGTAMVDVIESDGTDPEEYYLKTKK